MHANMKQWRPAEDVCKFKAVAHVNRKTKMVQTSFEASTLRHSASCIVVGAKTRTSLLTKDAAFKASVMAHGGKGKATAMRKWLHSLTLQSTDIV